MNNPAITRCAYGLRKSGFGKGILCRRKQGTSKGCKWGTEPRNPKLVYVTRPLCRQGLTKAEREAYAAQLRAAGVPPAAAAVAAAAAAAGVPPAAGLEPEVVAAAAAGDPRALELVAADAQAKQIEAEVQAAVNAAAPENRERVRAELMIDDMLKRGEYPLAQVAANEWNELNQARANAFYFGAPTRSSRGRRRRSRGSSRGRGRGSRGGRGRGSRGGRGRGSRGRQRKSRGSRGRGRKSRR